MFVGHYGVSFAARARSPAVPLWAWFLAVQWLDILWAPFVLLGIEKVRIVPGITASNPLDLYYMPYTHSLLAAVAWSAAAVAVCRLAWPKVPERQAGLLGLAVFSHWVLDFVVHRADLPLYDDAAKVGLGLWDHAAVAFALELALLFGGLALYLRGRRPAAPFVVFCLAAAAVQAWVFFGPPPASGAMAALTALAAYGGYAGIAAWLERRSRPTGPAATSAPAAGAGAETPAGRVP